MKFPVTLVGMTLTRQKRAYLVTLRISTVKITSYSSTITAYYLRKVTMSTKLEVKRGLGGMRSWLYTVDNARGTDRHILIVV